MFLPTVLFLLTNLTVGDQGTRTGLRRSRVEDLAQLAQLRDSGALTETEVNAQKRKLLD